VPSDVRFYDERQQPPSEASNTRNDATGEIEHIVAGEEPIANAKTSV